MAETMHHHSHFKTYIAIYLALLVLVGVTVAAAMVPTGLLAVPIALAIATIKAVLIILFFMHIKDEAPIIRVFAVSGFFFLGLLFVFTTGDYLTRGQMRADAAEVGVERAEQQGFFSPSPITQEIQGEDAGDESVHD